MPKLSEIEKKVQYELTTYITDNSQLLLKLQDQMRAYLAIVTAKTDGKKSAKKSVLSWLKSDTKKTTPEVSLFQITQFASQNVAKIKSVAEIIKPLDQNARNSFANNISTAKALENRLTQLHKTILDPSSLEHRATTWNKFL